MNAPVPAPKRRPEPPSFTEAELAELSASFEHRPAQAVIRWAVDTFGDALCLTTSLTDALLVDLALSVSPDIEVVFLDTGYHFPETLQTLEIVRDRYRPVLTVPRAPGPLDDRWQTDTDACCAQRKVAQLEAVLATKAAWLSGLRRADSPDRADTPIVQRDRRGLVKVNPIATWSDLDVEAYTRDHDVVVNPLVARGYLSVGCWPCTRAVAPGEDARAGRWSGSAKTECGLHL